MKPVISPFGRNYQSGGKKIWNQDKLEYTDGYTAEQREKIIEDVKREFEEKDTLQNASAVHLADVLLQNMELGKYIDNAGEINSPQWE